MIHICPRCQVRFVAESDVEDIIHECNSGNLTLDEEDVVITGDWSDYNSKQDIIIESNDTSDVTSASLFGNNISAQIFNMSDFGSGDKIKINKIKVRLIRVSVNIGNVSVSINETDDNGEPTSNIICSSVINSNDITTDSGGELVDITLSPRVILNGSTDYAIIIKSPDGVENEYYISWLFNANLYPNGTSFVSINNGSTWTQASGFDFMFEIYGDTNSGIINNVNLLGTENNLFGTRAAIEGNKLGDKTRRGLDASTHRQRQHLEFIKLKGGESK